MNQITKLILGLILFTFLYPFAFAIQNKEINSNKEKISFSFVLPATSAKMTEGKNGKILTLTVPDKKIIYFSDRPERIAGNMSLEQFVQQWNKGKDSFKKDPPNAILVHAGSEKGISLELTRIQLSKSGDTVTFQIISNDHFTQVKDAFLFIDAALAEYAVIL